MILSHDSEISCKKKLPLELGQANGYLKEFTPICHFQNQDVASEDPSPPPSRHRLNIIKEHQEKRWMYFFTVFIFSFT